MDSKALEGTLAKQAPRLLGMVRKRIPPSMEAEINPEDVLQEVWLSAFRNIDGFEERHSGSLAAWLTIITENKLMDAIRRLQAVRNGGTHHKISAYQGEVSSFVNLFDLITAPGLTPSRDVSAGEITHAVEIALHQLPKSNRLAMWSYYIEGMSVADVASRMGRTNAAVHFLLYAGRAKLGELLGNPGRFFSDVPEEDESNT